MRIELDDDFAAARRQIATAVAALPWNAVLSGSGYSGGTPEAKLAVLDALPLSELKVEPPIWFWEKCLPPRGEWRVPLCERGSDSLLCIPVVNRVDLLEKAVRSASGLLPNIALIDQTREGLADGWEGRAGIFRWSRRPLVFSEMMNWCQRLAAMRGCALLGFMHNDAECAPGVAEGVLDECRHANHRGARWGVALTNYDSFSWFNMTAVREVGCWDEAFQWYVADIDYYERLRAAGWDDLLLPEAQVMHRTSQTIAKMEPNARAAVKSRRKAAIRRYALKWGSPFGPGAPRSAVPFDGRPPKGE
jgi:hypothetical protein